MTKWRTSIFPRDQWLRPVTAVLERIYAANECRRWSLRDVQSDRDVERLAVDGDVERRGVRGDRRTRRRVEFDEGTSGAALWERVRAIDGEPTRAGGVIDRGRPGAGALDRQQ